eukprot:GFUD01021381.1.p1 GENE.GFUD01021381.1~~GFUD01021381.1.p1  ORF type:complete len:979 (+),score=194.06 GFUD01021381.1:418-3354(+)
MEFGTSPITSKNEMSSRRISINFDEFGKPLKDLRKSHHKDEVPKILTDIINYIKCFEPKKPYFCKWENTSIEAHKDAFQNAQSVQNILLKFLNMLPQPLIATEVTNILLKIQEKYGPDHPYLCNSRFRHALHQLPKDAHAVLHHLFHFLNSLCFKDINSDSDHSDNEGQTIDMSTCQHLGGVFVEYVFGNDWKAHGGQLMSEDFVLQTQRLLSRILSEFISEYRAIFEIESTIEHIVHEEREAIDADFHEHRKRHDKYDECPEDIKAMKVAWDELSLECTGSREASPAKQNKKHDYLEKNVNAVLARKISFVTENPDAKEISIDQIEKNSIETTDEKRIELYHSVGSQTENRNRIDCVKTFVHSTALNNNSATNENKLSTQTGNFFSDAPNSTQSCETNCCGKMGSIKEISPGCICPRKRKERQDSTSEQDRKFSRSSSLEFPVADLKVKWRSASVSPMVEDYVRGDHVLHEVQEYSMGNMKKLGDEQEETIEVFNRPRKKLTRNFNRKNRKERCDSLKENDQNGKVLQEQPEKSGILLEEIETNEDNTLSESSTTGIALVRKLNAEIKEVSPSQNRRFSSPPDKSVQTFKLSYLSQPVEDTQSKPCWVSQHLQHVMRVDTAKETMTMDNESPRTFNMINSERHLEHNQHLIERRLSEPLSPKKSKQKQLSRQLSSVKKKIEQLEQAFKQRTGYRPSQADKMNDSDLKKMITEQARIKKDQKTQKENSEVKENFSRKGSDAYNKCIAAISESLLSIEKKLEESRTLKLRPFDLDFMSLEQIFDEKLEMQTVLLDFERVHGHPETKDEKEVMKDLYERYRTVKRLARRSSSARSRETATDLAPIPEDEAISLTLASPGHRIILSIPTCQSLSSNCLRDDVDDLHVSKHDMDLPDIEHGNREDEHWHSMSREELVDIQRRVREEKKQLRRTVKEFEDTFKTKTGRKLQKEDREPFEKTYQLYKTTKSKLKLIDALLSKQP